MSTREDRACDWMIEIAAEIFEHLRKGGYDHSDDYYRPNESLKSVAEAIDEASKSLGITTPDKVARWIK